jgi:hypothetical protein
MPLGRTGLGPDDVAVHARAADRLEQSAVPDAGEATTMTEFLISAEGARVTHWPTAPRNRDQSRPASRIACARRAGLEKHNSWLPGT